jgi:hypothetical protein
VLVADSPVIDRVDASLLPVDVLDVDEDSDVTERLAIDHDGNARVQGLVDMGCAEQ